MAFTKVQIIREEFAREGGIRTGTRTYQVQATADLVEDAESATAASDGVTAVAAVGDLWKPGSNAKCKGVRASAFNEDPTTFEVTCSYSSKEDSTQTTIENPLARPNEYSYTDESFTEPYFRDTDGLPVVNSAGQPFQEMPPRDVSRGVITVTRNVATFNDLTAEGYRDIINSGTVSINGVSYAAKTLRIKSINAQGPITENGITYWRETTTILKNAATWEDKLEDRGLNELSSGTLKPILDAKNEPVTQPWPLNGSGVKMANATDTPSQITRKPYVAGSFPAGL